MAIDVRPPKFLNSPILSIATREKLNELDKFDIANLLDEDVEKSRNWFFTSSILTVSAMMFGLDELVIFGNTITIKQEIALATFGLLVVVSFFLGLYYLVNANSSYLAKFPKRALVSQHLADHLVELDGNKKSIKAGEGDTKNKVEAINNKVKEGLVDFESGFQLQLNILKYLPWGIFFLCNLFTVGALLFIIFTYEPVKIN
jgi:hypothetical protein